MKRRWDQMVRWMSLSIGLAVVVVVAGCATSGTVKQPAFNSESWTKEGFSGRRITTEHFTIYSTLEDAELEEALPGFLEASFKRYEKNFPRPTNKPIKLTSYIFGSRSQWERFTRQHSGARFGVYRRIRSGGYAEGDTSVSFFTSRTGTLATLAHEGFHQYVSARFETPIPAWLNEGLACYHEAFSFAGDKPKFTPRRNLFRIKSLRRALQQDELLELAEIVDTDAGEVISHNHSIVTQTYYAQSWALVTFLRHGKGGRHSRAFNRLLKDLADGTFGTRTRAAHLTMRKQGQVSYGEAVFVHYFGVRPTELTDEYYNHLVRICGF